MQSPTTSSLQSLLLLLTHLHFPSTTHSQHQSYSNPISVQCCTDRYSRTGHQDRKQALEHAEEVSASLEALSKQVVAREASLTQSERALTERQARLSQAADAARQELLSLRLDRKQVIC